MSWGWLGVFGVDLPKLVLVLVVGERGAITAPRGQIRYQVVPDGIGALGETVGDGVRWCSSGLAHDDGYTVEVRADVFLVFWRCQRSNPCTVARDMADALLRSSSVSNVMFFFFTGHQRVNGKPSPVSTRATWVAAVYS